MKTLKLFLVVFAGSLILASCAPKTQPAADQQAVEDTTATQVVDSTQAPDSAK